MLFALQVDDIDEEQKDRHLLSRRKVVPLPIKRACPETNPEALYQPGNLVNISVPRAGGRVAGALSPFLDIC
jgi:SAGA-associated factor 29